MSDIIVQIYHLFLVIFDVIIWSVEKCLMWAYNLSKEGERVPIRYKNDILAVLRDAGYSQNQIRVQKLMGQATLTQLRRGELVSWKNMETICRLLKCQPGDILEYVPEETEGIE